MTNTHEEWKEIKEVKGIYSVSNQGRVRNNRSGYILKPVEYHKGYVKVNLKVDGVSVNRQVHRLVAEAFIDNPENKPEVNHKNGIKDDNRVENLEWVTGEENRRHAYETGLVRHKDNRYSGYLYSLWQRWHKNEMCYEWRDYLTFYKWCTENGYKNGLCISRIDTTRCYSADNCIITNTMQHRKMSKNKRKRAYYCFGKLLSVEELAVKYNMSTETIAYRLKNGMSVEDAVCKPLSKRGRPRKGTI
jgi:hypothetical protein